MFDLLRLNDNVRFAHLPRFFLNLEKTIPLSVEQSEIKKSPLNLISGDPILFKIKNGYYSIPNKVSL